jgi:phage terminase large subunit
MMTDEQLSALTSPIGFAELSLGLSLYGWQDRALAPLCFATGPKARRVNVAVAAPNGSGKDERIIPSAAYWWVTNHKRGRVVITSKSDLQLDEQTIPQIERHKGKYLGFESVQTPRYVLSTPTGGQIIAFVTKEAGRVEGWHKEDDIDGPLLLILNEVKSMDDDIVSTLMTRCTPNAVLMVSSCGLKRGYFFKCFTEYRSQWICVQAGLLDCPHIPKDRIEYVKATYGDKHPVTRSTLYGEFMDQDEIEKFVVSQPALEFVLQNPPKHAPGMKVVFCDFADGGAENTIAYRDGNKIELVAAWREANKFASVGRFISEFRKLKVEANQVWGDAADKEMCDLLEEAGWKIHRQNFGSPANNKDIYLSWGAEAWRELSVAIEKREIILPKDDKLIEQLTTRMRTFGVAGKLGIEEKHSLKKRNIPSPDRADAVAGAHAVRDYQQLEARIDRFTNTQDAFERLRDSQNLAEIGADAGY